MASLLPLLFGVIIFSGIVKNGDCNETRFVKKVRSKIPDSHFYTLFAVSFRNKKDFKEAVRESINDFNQAAGVKILESLSKQIKYEAAKVGSTITSYQFFQMYTKAAYLFLKTQGVLTKQNEDKLAKRLAGYFNEAAKRVKKEDILNTLPAVNIAVAKFFKHEGIDGDQTKLKIFGEYLFAEVDKISENAENHDFKRTSFIKKVRSYIPDDYYYKLFTVSYKNMDDFKNAVQKAIDDFNKEADVMIPKSLSQEINQEAEKVGGFITADQLFKVYAYAVCHFLKNQGVLTKQNEDKLAKSFARYLIEAAEGLKDDDLYNPLPAINIAVAKLFKHEGIYGDQTKLKKFGEYLFAEVDKINEQCS